MSIISRDFYELLLNSYRLDPEGVHGPRHWARVHRNAMWVAEEMTRPVNTDVLEYFAFLHDACRINDGRDPGHGSRAAELARKVRGVHVHLDDENFYKLLDALIGHSSQHYHDDPTIQACWDADRLDLGRIGVIPTKEQLGTVAAKGLIWKCTPSQLRMQEKIS